MLYLYTCQVLCSFLYCAHVIFVILRLIKKLGHLKQESLDGKVWEWLTLSAVLGVWSHPDRACPVPSAALLAVPRMSPTLSMAASIEGKYAGEYSLMPA